MARLHYLDFEIIIQKNKDHFIAKVLESPTGEAQGTFQLPFSEDRLENLILKVGWARRSGRRIQSVEMDAARELGGKLFDAVLSGELRACLRASMEAANASDDTGLRIKLRLQDAPELADIPWEFLFDTSLDRFLSHSIQTPIVRYIEMPERIRPLAIELPLRVLVMIVSPINFASLDVEREKHLIEQALDPLVSDGKVVITCLENPTLSDIQRRLRSEQFNVFHFIGHSGFSKQTEEGVLILRDERGNGWQASGRLIGTLLHDHRTLRLAILNSCEGARNSRTDPFASVATTLILQGVPAVVAMQFEISDEAAITFSSQFYAALVDGYPVDAAVAEARKAIYIMPNDVEWGTPVLYLRSPDGMLFDVDKIKTEGAHYVPAAGAVTPHTTPPAESLPPIEEQLAEAEKRRHAEEVVRRQSEEQKRREEEQQEIAAAAKRQAEEAARKQAEAEAARQREEERGKAEKEMKLRAEEEERRKAEQEKRREEEQQKIAAAAKRQTEEAARQMPESETARQRVEDKRQREENTSLDTRKRRKLLTLMGVVLAITAFIFYVTTPDRTPTAPVREQNSYEEIVAAAQKGDSDAQFNLGIIYEKGEGVGQSNEKAVEWYSKAAEGRNPLAQYKLGDMYYYGRGVRQNYETAVEWYRKAAKEGNSDAQASLGFMYQKGQGVTKSYEKAVDYYRKAAEKGNLEAAYRLGLYLYEKTGATDSREEGKRWLQKAAEGGHEGAKLALARLANVPEVSHEHEATPPQTKASKHAIDRREVEEFVNSYLTATEERNTDRMMSHYADRVNYFSWGKVTKKDIRMDKVSHFKRWPESQAVYSKDLVVREVPGSADRVKARFSFRFHVRNNAKTVDGVAENVWILIKRSGNLKIVDEKQKILRRETTLH